MSYEFRGYYIPDRMMDGLQRYLLKGIAPGDFLAAVLSNDLYMACSHADEENLKNLPAYVGYLYNEANASAWGSRSKYTEWLNTFTPPEHLH